MSLTGRPSPLPCQCQGHGGHAAARTARQPHALHFQGGSAQVSADGAVNYLPTRWLCGWLVLAPALHVQRLRRRRRRGRPTLRKQRCLDAAATESSLPRSRRAYPDGQSTASIRLRGPRVCPADKMRTIENVANLLSYLDDEHQPLHYEDIISIWWALSKMRAASPRDLQGSPAVGKLRMLLVECLKLAPLNCWSVSNVLFASAVLHNSIADMDAISGWGVKRLLSFAGSANAQDVANSAWALAKLRHLDTEVMQALSLRAQTIMRTLNAQNVANLAWAYGSLFLEDRLLFDALTAQSSCIPGTLRPQALANMVWAFAKVSYSAGSYMPTLCEEISRSMSGFKAPELSITLWALAKLTMHEEGLFGELETHVERHMEVLQPQEISNVLWALGAVPGGSRSLLLAAIAAACKKASAFSSQGMANALWACGKTNTTSQLLVSRFEQQALEERSRFTPQELANLCWGLARSRVQSALFEGLVARAVVADPSEFDTQHLANIAWSFATLNQENHELFVALSRELLAGSNAFTPQGIVNILWAMATLNVDSRDVAEGVAEEVAGRLPEEFEAPTLAMLAWCYAKLTVQAALFTNLARAAIPKLDDLSLRDLSNLSWAFAVAGFEEGSIFLCLDGALARWLKMLQAFDGPAGELHEQALHIQGVIWALAYARKLTPRTRALAQKILRQIGQALDEGGVAIVTDGVSGAIPKEAPESMVPALIADFTDYLALMKPPGWEVFDQSVLNPHTEGWSRQLLRHLLRSCFRGEPPRITADRERNYGFLHRLDVPSSGLIIAAKTYKGYYDLQLQLSVGEFKRRYLALCHGWLALQTRRLVMRILQTSSGLAIESDCGKPAATLVQGLGAAVSVDGSAYSIVRLILETGRTHQIRCQTAAIGHPTVCDGKYTSQSTYRQDSLMCPRNFLHRDQLEFKNLRGETCKVDAELPPDLRTCLASLSPRSTTSTSSTHWHDM
eukprot:TRINITY_DN50730_c0_g1_i1.p1 TRINITY_DN50730_c0_g1~~TRINITY_DN50730_c0_g1_i1.p1  ORF type:complete len:965 (+),score=112.33 TRINITY_DN50730_c0_g1_i1:266-3160(+)